MTARFTHLKPHRLMLGSALLTWLLVTSLSLVAAEGLADFLLQSGAFVTFILLFMLVVFPREKLAPRYVYTALVVQVVLVYWLIDANPRQLSSILLVLVATQMPAYFSRRDGLLLLIGINIGFYLLTQQTATPLGPFTVLMYFMFQFFGFSSIDAMVREQKAKEQLNAVNQELLATRYLLKESSRRQERLRISRDLHDVLGHQLTGMALNLEVATHKVPDEFRPMLRQNLAQAKQLLNDVREVVKEMRSEEQLDLATELNALVAQLPDCRLQLETPLVINSLRLKQQLLFSLQEGISNALRHGGASEIHLACERQENALQLVMTDNGRGCDDVVPGTGLLGMQERLAEFNGSATLDCGPDGGRLVLKVEDSYD